MPNWLKGALIALVSVAGTLAISQMMRGSVEGRAGDVKVLRTADGKPDLNGIWQAVGSANWNLQDHQARTGPVLELGAILAVPAGLSVVEGNESLERYDRLDDGSRPGYAEIKLSSVTTGSTGKVDLIPPRDIHAEQGGPTRSVAVIIRSQKLGQGTVLQGRYDPLTKTRTEGYGPTQVPYELAV